MLWLGALAMSLTSTLTVALPLRTGVPPSPVPIVGGEAVEGSDWASVVAVLTPDPDDKTIGHLCSGTLVAPRIVLTAAHCIPPKADASKIEVYFGTQMTSHQRATGKRFGLHPDACVEDCDPEAMDFAFVEIVEEVNGVKFIPPLTEQADWDFAMVRHQPITLVGFGAVRDDEEEGAAPLREDERGRKRIVTTIIEAFTAHGEEVIAGSKGKDTCGGDSGGPAFVQIADGSWRQVGVTSRGVRPCGSGYGYYGVPYFALTWLRDETGVDLLPKGCADGDCLDTVVAEEGCGCRGGERTGGVWLLAAMLLWRRRRRVIHTRVALGLFVVGCGSAAPVRETSGGTGSEGTGPSTTSMGSTMSSESTTVGGSGPSTGFVVTPDLPPSEPEECDVFKQECEAGKKCAPVDDGNQAWCVSVLGDGVAGEPCTAENGGAGGLDDCAVGHMCWYLDARGDGSCVALCTGVSLSPICADTSACTLLADDSTLWLCLPKCDPLMQDCPDGEICGSLFDFVCLPDASGDEGQVNDPCISVDDCDPGLACVSDASAECDLQQSGACCSPFCPLPDGTCPGAEQECVAWYLNGEAPPGEEDVGVCRISA